MAWASELHSWKWNCMTELRYFEKWEMNWPANGNKEKAWEWEHGNTDNGNESKRKPLSCHWQYTYYYVHTHNINFIQHFKVLYTLYCPSLTLYSYVCCTACTPSIIDGIALIWTTVFSYYRINGQLWATELKSERWEVWEGEKREKIEGERGLLL